MVPSDRHSLLIETGGYPVGKVWAIHVLLNIFLTSPDDFDRALDLLCNLHGASDAVDLQPAPKTSANQMIVDDHLVQRQACGLCGCRLRPRDDLITDPDLATVLANMNRAIHRLHRGMGQERNLIFSLDFGYGAR